MSRTMRLRREIERLKAELSGVENGILPLLEQSPNLLTPQQVGEVLGFTPQGAGNHLSRLLSVGLVQRERVALPRGGRSYAYRVDGTEGEE